MGLDMGTAVEAALYGSPLGSSGQVLDLSAGTSQRSTVLSEGLWKLCATEACWVSQGGSSVAAVEATAPAELIPAGFVRYFPVISANDGYVAAIESGGTGGSVSISRADRR